METAPRNCRFLSLVVVELVLRYLNSVSAFLFDYLQRLVTAAASQLRPSLVVGFGGIQAVDTELPYRVSMVATNLAPYRIGKRPHKQNREKIHQKYRTSYFFSIFDVILGYFQGCYVFLSCRGPSLSQFYGR